MITELSGANFESEHLTRFDLHSPGVHATPPTSQTRTGYESSGTTFAHEQHVSNLLEDQTWQHIPHDLKSSYPSVLNQWNNPTLPTRLYEDQWKEYLSSAASDHPNGIYDHSFSASKKKIGFSEDSSNAEHTGSHPFNVGHNERGTPLPWNVPSAEEDLLHAYGLESSKPFSDPHHAFNLLSPHVQSNDVFGHIRQPEPHEKQSPHLEPRESVNAMDHFHPYGGLDRNSESGRCSN